jgi:hypothetical protein
MLVIDEPWFLFEFKDFFLRNAPCCNTLDHLHSSYNKLENSCNASTKWQNSHNYEIRTKWWNCHWIANVSNLKFSPIMFAQFSTILAESKILYKISETCSNNTTFHTKWQYISTIVKEF